MTSAVAARPQILRVVVALLLVASIAVAASRHGNAPAGADLAVVRSTTTTSTTTTTLPPTTTSVAPTTTEAPPPPPTPAPRPAARTAPRVTAAARPRPAPRPAPVPRSNVGAILAPSAALAAYGGLGTWVDVFDWSNAYTSNNPSVGVAEVDRMAEVGVQTLYIQASRHDSPTDVQEPERLLPIIDRAHQRGIRVVVWYLPTFEDVNRDLQRLQALNQLPAESVAVDIESTKVADVGERSRRLVELSSRFRQASPGRIIGAIVLPPVATEVINQNYWPGFPYKEIIPSYDGWMIMDYFTNRTQSSGYRDAYRYTAENIDRLRNNLGMPNAPVHPIGGIADKTTTADVDGMYRASAERGCIGGSLYDWRTQSAALWPSMQRFRV